MITCRDVTRQAGAWLDGELGLRQRMALRAHLFICINCRRYVAQLATTLNLVRAREWAALEEDAATEAEDKLAAMFRRPRDGGGSDFTCT